MNTTTVTTPNAVSYTHLLVLGHSGILKVGGERVK